MEKQFKLPEEYIEIPDEYIDRLMCRMGSYTEDEIKKIRDQLERNKDTSRDICFELYECSVKNNYRMSFKLLKEYFKDNIDEFESFISKIPDNEIKVFLKITSFYQKSTRIIDDCTCGCCRNSLIIRLIMMFSAIEKMMGGGKEYQDFHAWLGSRKNNKTIEPELKPEITNIKRFHETMDVIFKKYNEEWGSVQKVKKFFVELPKNDQKDIIQGFKFHDAKLNPKNIKDIAKILYDIRNQFVHNAHLDEGFRNENNDAPVLSICPDCPTITIPMTKIEDIFKRGVLEHYKKLNESRKLNSF